jgi:uncharacterized membrane protein (UPF0127 family)
MSRILTKDGSVVVSEVLFAETLSARMRGLLGRKNLPANTGMIIRPCQSIHMWFMQFSIDVAFLDADLTVLKIKRNLRPWQLAFAPRGTVCVLETAAGVLRNISSGTRIFEESTKRKAGTNVPTF